MSEFPKEILRNMLYLVTSIWGVTGDTLVNSPTYQK